MTRRSSTNLAAYNRRSSDGSYATTSAMDVADDAPDFWPVDPSAAPEESNPLLALDYTVIIGLNLYKVRPTASEARGACTRLTALIVGKRRVHALVAYARCRGFDLCRYSKISTS